MLRGGEKPLDVDGVDAALAEELIIDTTQVSGDITELASAAALGRDTWPDVGSLASALRLTDAP